MRFLYYGEMRLKETGEIIQENGAKSLYKKTINNVLKNIRRYAETIEDWTVEYTIHAMENGMEYTTDDEFDLMHIIQLQIEREEM